MKTLDAGADGEELHCSQLSCVREKNAGRSERLCEETGENLAFL